MKSTQQIRKTSGVGTYFQMVWQENREIIYFLILCIFAKLFSQTPYLAEIWYNSCHTSSGTNEETPCSTIHQQKLKNVFALCKSILPCILDLNVTILLISIICIRTSNLQRYDSFCCL